MQNSSIEWTDHTFNPWWGCTRISRACNNCYAEKFAKRLGKDVWGKKAPRRFLSDANWRGPVNWNAAAEDASERPRVFCASMADVFERRPDLIEPRRRLWALIEATPHLDWLLLTKRPENIASMVPWTTRWPVNVWIGTTVEDQQAADARLPHLCALPAVVRFISAEPLVGPLDLSAYISQLDWVITGGETGAGACPSSPSWFTALQQQCQRAGVAFHFKQWGDYAPATGLATGQKLVQVSDGAVMQRMGKTVAGRVLNGQTWDQFPAPRRR